MIDHRCWFAGPRRLVDCTPRRLVRPDKVGRERPPALRARDRDRGQPQGVAHAPRRDHFSSARR